MRYWVFAFFFFSAVADAAIYQWTDAKGTMHFSDSTDNVPANAKPLLLASPMAYNAENNFTLTTKTSADTVVIKSPLLVIDQPIDQSTLWENTGNINVNAHITPALKKAHHVGLWVDGKLMQRWQSTLHWQLKGLTRGAHQLQIQLMDDKGNIIAHSSIVTFYLQQAVTKKTA